MLDQFADLANKDFGLEATFVTIMALRFACLASDIFSAIPSRSSYGLTSFQSIMVTRASSLPKKMLKKSFTRARYHGTFMALPHPLKGPAELGLPAASLILQRDDAR